MLNPAWKKASLQASLPYVSVDDLKPTCRSSFIRAAGVGFEDRRSPLGHKSEPITTHYSNTELNNLIQAVGTAGDIEQGLR